MKKFITFLFSAMLLSGGYSAHAEQPAQATKTEKPAKQEITAENVTKEQIEAFQMMYAMMQPEQKEKIAEEVRKGAAKIKPDEKEAIIKRAQTHYNSLDDNGKSFLRAQLMQIGSKLTPEERNAYLKRLEE